MNTILTHYVPFKSIVLSQCFVIFVATLDEILLCFLKKARSRQSYCASHVARIYISAFHRPGKNAQVVTSLQQTCSNVVPTACQQDVFALPITRCSNRLVPTC